MFEKVKSTRLLLRLVAWAMIVSCSGMVDAAEAVTVCDTNRFEGFFLAPDTKSTIAITKQAYTWDGASAVAKAAGGRLVVLTGAEQNSAVSTSLGSFFTNISTATSTPQTKAWIDLVDPLNSPAWSVQGGSAVVIPSRFSWADDFSNYSNWGTGQPDGYCTATEQLENPDHNCYGEPWVTINSDGTWSDEGTHATSNVTLKGVVEWPQQTLDCVAPVSEPVVTAVERLPGADTGAQYCTDATKAQLTQCVDTSSGEKFCPNDKVACNAVYENPSCPPGSTLNTTRDMCQADGATTCPSTDGYLANPDLCYKDAQKDCNAGYSFDSTRNRCEKIPECPIGTTYNATTNKCASTPACASGIYNQVSNQCDTSFSTPAIYMGYVGTTGSCWYSGTYGAGANDVFLKALNDGSYQLDFRMFADYHWDDPKSVIVTPGEDYIYRWTYGRDTVRIRFDSNTKILYEGGCKSVDGWVDRASPLPSSQYFGNIGFSTGGCDSTAGAKNVTVTSVGNGAVRLDYNLVADYTSSGNRSAIIYPGEDYIDRWTYGRDTARIRFTGTLFKGGCKSSDDWIPVYGYTPEPVPGSISSTCSSGTYLDTDSDQCLANPTCTGGNFDGNIDVCWSEYTPVCNDPAFVVQVPGQPDLCQSPVIHDCPVGTTWNGLPIAKCEAVPICTNGMYLPSSDTCYNNQQSCPLGNFQCVQIAGDTSQVAPGVPMQYCSPNVCQSDTSGWITDTDTESGLDDKKNDGDHGANGECLGNVYLYNGTDMRCRLRDLRGATNSYLQIAAMIALSATGAGAALAGTLGATAGTTASAVIEATVQMTVSAAIDAATTGVDPMGVIISGVGALAGAAAGNFADVGVNGLGDMVADTVASLGFSSGIDVMADPALSNIIQQIGNTVEQYQPEITEGLLANYNATKCCHPDKLSGSCKTEEFSEAKLAGNGACHIVGSYCSSKILAFCMVKKQTSCCFSSKLARIFHEQGRPQLTVFGETGAWGTPRHPNCRGFTPAEFQSLNFGAMDLSEYIEDLNARMDQVQPLLDQYMGTFGDAQTTKLNNQFQSGVPQQ